MRAAREAVEAAAHELQEGNALLSNGDETAARARFLAALELATKAASDVVSNTADHHTLFLVDLRTRMSLSDTWLLEDAALAETGYRFVDAKMRELVTALGYTDLAESPYAEVHADALSRLALALEYQYKLVEARATYQAAIDIYQRADVGTIQYASTLEGYGDLLRKHGDLDRALEVLERARSLVPTGADDPNVADLAYSVTLHLGQVYADRQQFEKALPVFLELLEAAQTHGPDSRAVAIAHGEIGRALQGLGDIEGTREHWTQALRIHELLDPASDDAARTHNALGELAYHEGLLSSGSRVETFRKSPQLRVAARHFERSLSIRTAQRSTPEDLGMVLFNAGATRQLLDDVEGAKACFERALELYRQTPQNIRAAGILAGLGRALHDLGRVDEAIDTLRDAIAIVESLRTRAGGTDARESLFGGYQQAYDALIAYLFEHGTAGAADEAFHVAEGSRARVLVELLAERDVDIDPLTAEQRQLLEERAALERRLTALYEIRQGQKDADASALVPVRDEERTLEAALESVERRIRTAFRAYAELTYPTVIGAEEAQALLRSDTLLLEYATGEDSFVWAIRQQGRAMMAIPASGARIRELVEAAVGHYDRPDWYDQAAAARAITELSTLLLRPIPPEAFEGVRRLIVVPDGALHYLPFEILAVGDGVELLGDRLAITYAPSATVLESLQRNWRSGAYRLDFVGFGDPAFEAAPRVERASGETGRARFAGLRFHRLRGSGDEVRTIAAAFGERGQAFVREQATEYRAKSECEGARFVHFATHGVVSDEEPLFSGLALAPPQQAELDADPHLDDMLQAREMFSLRLSAEAVVCSACRTALGKLHDGEGIVGMTRALLFAGARCAVVSLWPVDDSATSALMQTFYDRIRDGLSVADALKDARTMVRERWPDPRDWAAFIVVGLGW